MFICWSRGAHSAVFLISFLLNGASSALHEDQAGVHDWRLQLVGRPHQILIPEQHSTSSDSAAAAAAAAQLAFVLTDQHVLAGLQLKNGAIAWRQVLEDGPAGIVESGFLTNNDLCAMTNQGRVLRCFDQQTGGFSWEFILSTKLNKPIDSAINTIICATDLRVVSLSAKNGKIIWERKLADEGEQKHIFIDDKSEITLVSLHGAQTIRSQKLSAASGDLIGVGFETTEMEGINSDSKCQFVLAADQTSPHLVCLSSANGITGVRLQTFLAANTETPIQTFSFEQFGPVHLENINITAVKSPRGLFTVETADNAYLFHLSARGKVVLTAEGAASTIGGAAENFLLARTDDQQQAVLMFGNVDAQGGLIRDAETARLIAFPENYGPLKKIVALPSSSVASSGVMPPIVFWTSGDVLGFISNGNIVWTRQEGLAAITTTAILDLPISDIEALVEEEFQEKGSFVTRFGKRLISQALQLQKTSELLVKRVMSGLKIGTFFRKDVLERDYFNTQKLIVGMTDNGRVMGIDSRNGDLVYSFHIPHFCKPRHRKIAFYLQRSGAHKPHASQAVIIGENKQSGNGLLYFFDAMTGQKLQEPISLHKPILQSGMIPVMTSDHLESVFVMESDLSVSVYPDLAGSQNFLLESVHIVDADVGAGTLKGYRVKLTDKRFKAQEIWTSFLAAPGEKIIGVSAKRPHDMVHSQGRVLADRRVLYKYINPNLVALAVQGMDETKKPFVKLVSVDGITGRVVLNTVHRRCRGPVHITHAEHWIMYSYWNEKSRANEITVVELYRGFEKPNSTYFSSMESTERPEISTASFRLPGFISAMADTVTVEGMTYKALIVALTSGSVVNIPKMFLDPRRPMIPTQAEREEGLIPYAPELPLITENVINYYHKVERIRGIATGVAGLESISLVFVYGLDLFFTRVTPSANFDVLSDSFDYWILSVVMLVMTIASLIVRNMANAKALKHAWR